jgi:hypothetical protein
MEKKKIAAVLTLVSMIFNPVLLSAQTMPGGKTGGMMKDERAASDGHHTLMSDSPEAYREEFKKQAAEIMRGHQQMQEMMRMMQEMMGLMKEMTHDKATQNRVNQMMDRMEKMMKKHEQIPMMAPD